MSIGWNSVGWQFYLSPIVYLFIYLFFRSLWDLISQLQTASTWVGQSEQDSLPGMFICDAVMREPVSSV